MTSDAPKAVVAGHGAFAAGLISAVEQIAGRADRFVAVSNAGLAPGEIELRLREALDASGAQVIFTDLPAGSCTIAARRIQRERPDLVLVTGAALPTVLSFACGCDAEKAVQQGHAALALVEPKRDA